MHTAGCLSVVSEHPVFLSTFFDDDEVFDNPKEVKDEWCLTGLRWNLPLSVLDCCPIVSFGVIYQDCSDAIGLDSNAQRETFSGSSPLSFRGLFPMVFLRLRLLCSSETTSRYACTA